MTASSETHPFGAEAVKDSELNTTVLTLSYTDAQDPERNLLACIAPQLGSNFYRFKVGEHELLYCEKEMLLQCEYTGNFVLWPLPNRIRDKRYTFQGHEYSLASVTGRSPVDYNLLHGLVFDQPWSYDNLHADQNSASVTTFIEITPESPHYAGYPFPSRLSLTYTLTREGITTTYTIQNRGSQTLPYGFALHPYFHLLSGSEGTLVTLPAAQVMETDTALLPTGRVLNVQTTMYAMFDLNQPTPIERLKLDHTYTALPPGSRAMIDYRGLDLSLHISASEEFTHIVIYTPGEGAFFCLENQTCSTDAINLHHQGRQDIAHLLQVQPGDEASGSLRYEIVRK